jgi:hypothetical protein
LEGLRNALHASPKPTSNPIEKKSVAILRTCSSFFVCAHSASTKHEKAECYTRPTRRDTKQSDAYMLATQEEAEAKEPSKLMLRTIGSDFNQLTDLPLTENNRSALPRRTGASRDRVRRWYTMTGSTCSATLNHWRTQHTQAVLNLRRSFLRASHRSKTSGCV